MCPSDFVSLKALRLRENGQKAFSFLLLYGWIQVDRWMDGWILRRKGGLLWSLLQHLLTGWQIREAHGPRCQHGQI